MSNVKRRMTAEQFDAVLPLLNISKERIEAAREALVDGQILSEIGKRFGWSRQAVGDAVSIVVKKWAKLEDHRDSQRAKVPPGWKRVTFYAPQNLILKFEREIAQARAKLKESPAEGRASKST